LSDTYKTTKISFVTSWAEDIIRTAYYILGRDVMKLVFAVYVSLNMSLNKTWRAKKLRLWIDVCCCIIRKNVFVALYLRKEANFCLTHQFITVTYTNGGLLS